MSNPIDDDDPAAALENEEAIAVFLADASETGDATYIPQGDGRCCASQGHDGS